MSQYVVTFIVDMKSSICAKQIHSDNFRIPVNRSLFIFNLYLYTMIVTNPVVLIKVDPFIVNILKIFIFSYF